jgi:hypothetical protein
MRHVDSSTFKSGFQNIMQDLTENRYRIENEGDIAGGEKYKALWVIFTGTRYLVGSSNFNI